MNTFISVHGKIGWPIFIGFCFVLLMNETFVGYVTAFTLFSLLAMIASPIRKYGDATFAWLFAFVIVYLIMGILSDFIPNLSFVCKNLFPPLVFYLLGAYFIDTYNTKRETLFLLVFLILTYSFVIYASTVYSILTQGSIVTQSVRVLTILGDESKQMAATMIGLTAAIGMCGLPSFMVIDKKYGMVRILFLMVFIASCVTTVHMVNRTAIIIAMVSLLTVMLVFHNSIKGYRLLFLMIVLFLLGSFYIASSDIGMAYANRAEVEDNAGTFGERSGRWVRGLQYLLEYPFGWLKQDQRYVHNMWLDFARVGGIFPFLLSVILSLKSVGTLFKILRIRKDEVTAVLLGMHMCFLMSCFMEPVYAGTHWYMYCLFIGLQSRYYYNLINGLI